MILVHLVQALDTDYTVRLQPLTTDCLWGFVLQIGRPGNLSTGLHTFRHIHDKRVGKRDSKRYFDQKRVSEHVCGGGCAFVCSCVFDSGT